jgi:hypothetical protein
MKKEDPQTYGREDSNFDIFLSHDWPKSNIFFIQTSHYTEKHQNFTNTNRFWKKK